MTSEWSMVKAKDFMDFNPHESVPKGAVVKKVAMEWLQPFTREISAYEVASFNGGSKFRNGDTLMARITPCLENGKTAQVNILDDGEVGFGSTEFIVLRAKSGISDKDFIYYLAMSPLLRDKAIKSMVGSSGRQRVQQGVLNDTELWVPSLPEQVEIGHTLRALDDKIANNTKINHHLDQMAQVIYKSWFVDLEPSFVRLGEVCECVLGGTPSRAKPEYWGGSVPWINSGKVNEFRITEPSEWITETGLNNSATKLLPAKTTVLAITGATLGQVSLLEIEACANQSVVGIVSSEILPYTFLYPFIVDNIDELISHQTGGAQQHINKQNIESLEVPCYPEEVIAEYDRTVAPIFEQIGNNCFESVRLAELRDTLLPRLMAGELSADDT